MQTYLNRELEKIIEDYRTIFPVVAILGPRQCGKSSLARFIYNKTKNSIYLDLEKSSDLNKIATDPDLFFTVNKDKTIFLDEIQRFPHIFTTIRNVCDYNKRLGWIIILGSSSPELLQQSSESLAGRIGYLELTPFLFIELSKYKNYELINHWLKGGYPISYFLNEQKSIYWRENFIRTFIERDIPSLEIRIPSITLKRFLNMIAHYHGQIINLSKIGESLGVSHHTVRKYIDIFQQTFILRILLPFETNLKKRLIKTPKTYVRDSGILHSLLKIESFNNLMGNPSYGASWEGFALENILSVFTDFNAFFLRTASGVEIDLLLQKADKLIAIEFKATTNPKPGRGFYLALEYLKIKESWIISPIDDIYPIKNNINVSGLKQFFDFYNKH